MKVTVVINVIYVWFLTYFKTVVENVDLKLSLSDLDLYLDTCYKSDLKLYLYSAVVRYILLEVSNVCVCVHRVMFQEDGTLLRSVCLIEVIHVWHLTLYRIILIGLTELLFLCNCWCNYWWAISAMFCTVLKNEFNMQCLIILAYSWRTLVNRDGGCYFWTRDNFAARSTMFYNSVEWQ